MAKILTCYYRPKPGGFCKRLFRSIDALLKNGHIVHYLAVVPFPISHQNCYYHHFPWPEKKADTLLFWIVFHLTAPLVLLWIGIRHRITHIFAFGHTYGFMFQPLRCIKKSPLSLFLRADTLKNHTLKQVPKWLITIDKVIEGMAITGVRLYGVSKELAISIPKRHTIFKPVFSKVFTNDIKKLPSDSSHTQPYTLPLRIGCVGILEKRKNQTLLMDMMQQVSSDKAHLFLYGVGPDRDFLEKKIKTDELSEKVSLMGWVDAQIIWNSIDLLLMPSLHEGCPNAVLEALEKGIPVLASRIPEHMETLPQSQLIKTETSEWAKGLRKIIDDPETELNLMQKNQLPYAKSFCFDWDSEVCKRILK